VIPSTLWSSSRVPYWRTFREIHKRVAIITSDNLDAIPLKNLKFQIKKIIKQLIIFENHQRLY
jgi:hypothetical protein